MFIDKFKEGSGYVDKNGCWHDDALDFISIGIFNFCGCGSPEETLKYIHDCLQIVKDGTNMDYKEFCECKSKIFNNNSGAENFMWYFLDNQELTEHGSSVPGWITDYGEEMLSDMKQIINDLGI